MAAPKLKVSVIGAGSWGTTVAKIVAENVQHLDHFEDTVTLAVYDEPIGKRMLTEVINTDHENVKYMPGVALPKNLVAKPDSVACAQEADVIVFGVPHQFALPMLRRLAGKLKPNVHVVSLSKGAQYQKETKRLELVTELFEQVLGLGPTQISCLMGANTAPEVARGELCEATLGCDDMDRAKEFAPLFHNSYFLVTPFKGLRVVELCGALKNVVAIAAGVCDGLEFGTNTKATVMRLGLREMARLMGFWVDEVPVSVLLESCGVADLITTCFSGRHRKVAEQVTRTGDDFAKVEEALLNGQKLQGTETALAVYEALRERGLVEHFPVFVATYRIVFENAKPFSLIESICTHRL